MYVTRIDPQTNTVVLGQKEDLNKREMSVRDINLIKYPKIQGEMEALTKVRYKDQGAFSTTVLFSLPRRQRPWGSPSEWWRRPWAG